MTSSQSAMMKRWGGVKTRTPLHRHSSCNCRPIDIWHAVKVPMKFGQNSMRDAERTDDIVGREMYMTRDKQERRSGRRRRLLSLDAGRTSEYTHKN